MRLTSLSRKLGVTRDEIVNHLKSKNIEVSDGVNTKLSDDQVKIVTDKFQTDSKEEEKIIQPPSVTPQSKKDENKETAISEKPVKKEKTLKKPKAVKASKKTEELENAPVKKPAKPRKKKVEKVIIEKEVEEPIVEVPRPSEDESLEEFIARQNVDVIKVKKIKLEGIKVLGKIDLPAPPEPKAKEEPTEKIEEQPKAEEEKKPRGLYGDYLNKTQKPRKVVHERRKPRKPLSFTEKQELEKKRLEREKEKELILLKKKKKEHYNQKVVLKKDVSKELKTKKVQEVQEIQEVEEVQKTVIPAKIKAPTDKVAPKKGNVISRFWAWLNGEYDKF